MTSKIIVNTIEADTGISSVTFASNINLQNDSSILVSSSGVTLGTGSTIAAPSANELALSTNSAERLRIDANGHVGIDCTPDDHNNFSRALDVNGPSGAAVYMRTNDSTSNCFIVGNYGSEAYLNNRANGNLRLYTNSSERLRITNTGLVGIGTNNPGALLSIPAGESNTPRFAIESAVDDNDFTITQYEDGNGTYTMIGQNVKLNSGGNTTVLDSAHKTAGILFDARSNGNLTFYTGGNNVSAERLRISSDGKVCVGTTLTNYGVLQIRDASGDSTTSAIQVENASSGNSTTNVILRSVSLNSGAWANAEYRAKSHVFSYQTTPVVSVLANFGPWAEGNKGTTRGTLHLRPADTDHMGGAITFGASDRDSGDTAMAGIYTRTDGNYGTKMYFATTDSYSAGPKNAMTIDHQGYVTKSNTPAFFVYKATSTWTLAANDHFVFDTAEFNIGSHYNTSNGRFTAPITARYVFHFYSIYTGNATGDSIEMYKNGSRMNGGDVHFTNDVGGNWDTVHYSRVIQLSSGDYVHMQTRTGHTFHGNHWGGWSGYMLG